jgi:hypothetical protein
MSASMPSSSRESISSAVLPRLWKHAFVGEREGYTHKLASILFELRDQGMHTRSGLRVFRRSHQVSLRRVFGSKELGIGQLHVLVRGVD